MKKKLFFAFCFLLSSLFVVLNSTEGFSQTNWNPIGLNVVGHNTMSGVEASYQLNTCNGEDVVFVKLVNHNAYAVTVEWYPGVFTKELKWIKKENPSDKKSISLNANAESAGDCAQPNTTLIMFLKDFQVDKSNFYKYGALNFSVNKAAQ